MINLYRAVPRENFDPEKRYHPIIASKRIPSNVPYLVDNLWEWLRPDNMPSRRHSVYASPTPALALANASAGDNDFIACQVTVDAAKIRIAHLDVEDARYHPDIKNVSRLISLMSPMFSGLSIEKQRDMGILFMPGLSRETLDVLRTCVPEVNDICAQFASFSTFWKDASLEVGEHNGELFFELVGDHYYTLKIV